MREAEEFPEEDNKEIKQTSTKTVYTDGGCIKVAGGTRAGDGIYWGENNQKHEG